MTTYNTGNPIGSTDSRDRLDNTENMDYLENSTTELTHPDRLGTVRKTRHGMEAEHDNQIAAHEVEHDNQMQSFETDFDGRLAGMAFTRVGSFTAGATLIDMRQVLVWEASKGGDGHEYGWTGSFSPSGKVVIAGSNPETTGGIGAGAWVDRTQETLRSEINIVVKRFNSVADMVADESLVEGQRIFWLGYYAESDGGSNWGIVKSGAHTHDGGSIFSLANGLYVEANLKGKRISVKKFGAKGDCDGTTGNGQDDTTYIQNALDYLENNGGGIALLARTKGQYRTTSEIRIPSYCTLEGVNKSRYPFNNAVASNSCLCADFAELGHWVVDSKTKNAGSYYAYNATTGYATPSDLTHNSAIKDVLIRSVGVIPYGGIRFIGCPGSVVDNCSAYNVSIGLLVNWCFGGSYVFHGLTHYYGAILWDSANANDAEIYATKITTSSQVVPTDYLPAFMAARSTSLVSTDKLSTNDHYNRAFGLIVGSNGTTTSTGNKISYTGEKFSGGSFQLYSYGTVFNKYYVEGATGEMLFGLVAAFSRYSTDNWHCYLEDGSAVQFDMGVTLNADYRMVGLRKGSYGFGPYADNTSSVTFHDVNVSTTGFPKQFNVFYTYGFESKTPTLLNSWTNTGGIKRTSNYIYIPQLNRVKLRGSITGGSNASPAFLLNSGFRPPYAIDFTVNGGVVRVLADGNVYVTSGTTVDLDAVEFEIF